MPLRQMTEDIQRADLSTRIGRKEQTLLKEQDFLAFHVVTLQEIARESNAEAISE